MGFSVRQVWATAVPVSVAARNRNAVTVFISVWTPSPALSVKAVLLLIVHRKELHPIPMIGVALRVGGRQSPWEADT
jgi:hypothetical protein